MIVNPVCSIKHTTVADVDATYSVPFTYVTVLNVPQITVTLDGTELTYMTDYTLGSSGLKLTAEPEAGLELFIERTTPLTQDVDFQTGMINPDEIEKSFDLSVMRDQEIQRDVDIIESKIPAEASPDNQLVDKAYADAHIERTDNPHSVTKAQVGLGNCDNTSDLDKPISTATQAALDLKANTADLAAVATAGTLASLNDTNITQLAQGHFLMFDGTRWINNVSSGTVGWGGILGTLTDQTDLKDALDSKVNIDGTSVMTGPLKMAAGSMRGAISPFLNGVAFWKMDAQNNITQIANLSDTQFHPVTTGGMNLGAPSYKWKDLYLAGDEYLDNGKHIRFAGTASNRYFDIETNQDEIRFIHKYGSYEASLSFRAYTGDVVLYPQNDDKALFGLPTRRWQRVYATNLCSDTSGANLVSIPNQAGTIALLSDIAFKSTDVELTTPSAGEFLRYDGTKWVNSSDAYATTNLNNLTATGANIANWSSNVTNCIPEIPQDIKLEVLYSGTVGVGVKLKAGSKVYVPNGPGVFTEVITSSDLTAQGNAVDALVCLDYTHNTLRFLLLNNKLCSGDTDSLAGTGIHTWYNTSNNQIISYDENNQVYCYCSLPVAKVSGVGVFIDTIDQVFNGFGYIASTIFVLPGVKGLCPDGRNTDGTLKNTTLTVDSVKTTTYASNFSDDYSPFVLVSWGVSYWGKNTYYGGSRPSNPTNYTRWYSEEDNYWYEYVNGWSIQQACVVGVSTVSSGKVTSFKSKKALRAVDYNDTEFIAHQAMPSSKYVDLILGASGTPYTAPADGYICISKDSTAAGEWISIGCNNIGVAGVAVGSGNDMVLNLPVKKGATATIYYALGGTTHYFRFIYANGAV